MPFRPSELQLHALRTARRFQYGGLKPSVVYGRSASLIGCVEFECVPGLVLSAELAHLKGDKSRELRDLRVRGYLTELRPELHPCGTWAMTSDGRSHIAANAEPFPDWFRRMLPMEYSTLDNRAVRIEPDGEVLVRHGAKLSRTIGAGGSDFQITVKGLELLDNFDASAGGQGGEALTKEKPMVVKIGTYVAGDVNHADQGSNIATRCKVDGPLNQTSGGSAKSNPMTVVWQLVTKAFSVFGTVKGWWPAIKALIGGEVSK